MRNKLRIGFLLIIVFLWAIGVYWVSSSVKLRDISLHVQEEVFPTIVETGQMHTQLNEVREVTLSYIVLGDTPDERKVPREQLEKLYQSIGQFAAKHLAHTNVVDLRAREDAEKLASLAEELIVASSDATRLKDEGAEYRELREKMETDFEPIFWSLEGLLDELAEKHEEELLACQATVANQSNTNITLTLVFTIIATLAAIMVAIIVDRLFLTYLTERKKMEKALEKERYGLGERVKELDCLYGISRLVEKQNISLEEILEGTVNLIPPSWQYPEVAASRIILEGQTFKTKNFKETPWKLASDIMVGGKRTGLLQVIYLEERPESDEGPFLKEERNLTNAIAERLGRIIGRKRMEIELRIKEEAIASSLNAIVLADLEGNLNYVNRSFLHMWGYSDEKEVLGKPVTELWNVQGMALDVMEAVRSNRSWMGELVARRKDDSVFDVQLLANIVENEAGKAMCMMASVIDITERKKIEQMKSDFVALASHELRTPLTSIHGYAELMLDGDVGEISREQKEFLEIISQNTRRLEALINDVLDVEKIESGRMTMKWDKVDLSQIVDNCVNTFKVMAEDKSLKLEKDVKTSPINVLGDFDRLSQVFDNLLSNAIKYTEEGRAKITAEIKGEFASIAVEDTGLGMSPEDMKIVFNRFFRAEDNYVRKTTGSGLGLSIAKATIERHNGDIKVESKLGAGSKFEVILPLFKESEGAGQ